MAPAEPCEGDEVKVSVVDETSKAPASDSGKNEETTSVSESEKQASLLDEAEQKASEEKSEAETISGLQAEGNVGGGKEIDESVSESLAQPQPEVPKEEESVDGPELTSDRVLDTPTKQPSVVTALFERAGSAIASAEARKQSKQETDEVVDSVMEMATPWVQFAVAQAQGLKKTMVETTDVAVKAACNQIGELQDATTTHYYYAKDSFWRWRRNYRQVESAFFSTLKDGVKSVADNPTLATTLGIAATFVLFRRPRRFLFKHTLGRFRSTESMVANAQHKIHDLQQSVNLQNQEKKKLEERYMYAMDEFLRGRSKMGNAGAQIRSLVRHMYKTENRARGILENLRDLPAKDTLALRAEVASIQSEVKQQRNTLDKHLNKIASYNVSV